MINFGALNTGGFQNALATGLQLGGMRRQQEQENALMQQRERQIAVQEQRVKQQMQEEADKKRLGELETVRKLLVQAGSEPMRALQAAQSMNIDTSAFPQPGTPEFEPWRQQQLFILDALEKEGDNLPGLVREVMFGLPEDQRDPNSPAFRQAYVAALENKYAAEYTDAQGNTRRRAIIGQQQPAENDTPQAANVPTISPEQWQANVQSLTLPRAINWAVSNGIALPISGDDDYAQLPSGAAFVGPDGLIRRKP